MENETKQSKPLPKPRIALTDESKQILEKWRYQLIDRFPGISVSDADLVNWFISRQSVSLTVKQLADIRSAFFDEVKELEWRLKQAKAAKQLAPRHEIDLPANDGLTVQSGDFTDGE